MRQLHFSIATADHTPELDPPYHRYSVGMRNGYDLMGGLQFTLLFALGLREWHRVCDVGCGSLRAGRLLIPYLAPGNYYGIEPRQEIAEAGMAAEVGADLLAQRVPHFDFGADFGLARFDTPFDYVLAQSVFSHTFRDLTTVGLDAISAALGPDGLFVGTVYEEFPILLPRGHNDRPDEGSGFLDQGAVAYTWREWTSMLARSGLVGRRIRWYHTRQTWFVAMRAGRDDALKAAVREAIPRLRGPGFIGHVKRRALGRLKSS